jgi:hypothetical protein
LKECNVFGVSSDEYLGYALHNRAEWEDRGQDMIKSIIEECDFVLGIADETKNGESLGHSGTDSAPPSDSITTTGQESDNALLASVPMVSDLENTNSNASPVIEPPAVKSVVVEPRHQVLLDCLIEDSAADWVDCWP